MSPVTKPPESKLKTLIWGCLSILLYGALLMFEQPIMALSSQGKWFFIVPVTIAFIFSFVHGRFTEEFWRSLGIRAKY
ncbi:MAG: hypothetical protein HQL95_13930 [Magnetococcales bacterium]|nr:hypothetical protein [Magnetococcales bacterium]